MHTVLVTVGSTRFDALVHAALAPPFLDAVHFLRPGSRVYVQYGTSALTLPPAYDVCSVQDTPATRFVVGRTEVWAFAYVPDLPALLNTIDIVVTHAGAGTLLAALRAPNMPRILAVPNPALMDDHQRELADALADRYLQVGTPRYVVPTPTPPQPPRRRPPRSGAAPARAVSAAGARRPPRAAPGRRPLGSYTPPHTHAPWTTPRAAPQRRR